MVPRLNRKGYSYHSIITKATFVHHLGIATGELDDNLKPSVSDRQSAFMTRAGIMGLLINSSNLDLAQRYHRMVSLVPSARNHRGMVFPRLHPRQPAKYRFLPSRIYPAPEHRSRDHARDRHLYGCLPVLPMHHLPSYGARQGPHLWAESNSSGPSHRETHGKMRRTDGASCMPQPRKEN